MKLSKLIADAQRALAEHGDIEVIVVGGDNNNSGDYDRFVIIGNGCYECVCVS